MERQDVSSATTQDERILAALSHASVILPFWGLIGSIVIWATQREKSSFVGFQALQGVAYQIILVLGAFVGGACYACSFFGLFLLTPVGILAAEEMGDPNTIGGLVAVMVTFATTFFPFCIMSLFILIGLAFVLYGLYGAVRVLQGHHFRYAVVGRRLEEYLNREESAE
jgi:uncharacterized Tic20 family protein